MSKPNHKMVKSSLISSIRVNMHTFKLISRYNGKATKFLKDNNFLADISIMVNNEVPDGQADIYGVKGEYIDRIKLK